MAGTYFDFPNTPITKDITLKAKWCCDVPAGPLNPTYTDDEMWDSDDAARIVLTDGRVVICEATNYMKMNMLFCGGSVDSIDCANGNKNNLVDGFKLVNADGSLTSISVSGQMVQSIELGRGYIDTRFTSDKTWGFSDGFSSAVFPNIIMFKGFAEGTLMANPSPFFRLPSTLVGAVINIPSTFGTTGNFLVRLPIGTTQKQIAKVIFNNPNPPSNSTYKEYISAYNLSCGSNPNASVPPIPVTGPYVDQWKAAYPNRNPMGSACSGRNWVKI